MHLVGHGSRVGQVRPFNEDYHRVWQFPVPRGTIYLYAVADGMGGAAAGEVASKTAVEVLDDAFSRYAEQLSSGALDKAMRLANRRVFAAAQSEARRGMGTALTCLAILDNRAYLGHVGDSRAYLFRGDTMFQLTKDHSWVEEQVAQGLLTPEQGEQHEWRNLITRALGTRPQVTADIIESGVKAGDVYVLASDGLHGLVKPDEIAAELRRTRDRQHAVEYMISLANERGGHDNITVVVAEVVR
ncbi:MAG: Stp1/IreP family PP2C-type Ser/Thr phosphatase [bacterium]|nr:Stp1/IreP family PP2C-type Ser/Thr phosphatase [bacterium]